MPSQSEWCNTSNRLVYVLSFRDIASRRFAVWIVLLDGGKKKKTAESLFFYISILGLLIW